jgi:hypothetical protein
MTSSSLQGRGPGRGLSVALFAEGNRASGAKRIFADVRVLPFTPADDSGD